MTERVRQKGVFSMQPKPSSRTEVFLVSQPDRLLRKSLCVCGFLTAARGAACHGDGREAEWTRLNRGS